MTRIVVIDNYDSFTYNLVHALATAGADVVVHRNDAVTRQGIAEAAPDGLVLSPGPGHPGEPRDFGVCTSLVREPLDVPMLGVCLGMQGMAFHTGGTVAAAPELVHGESDRFTPGDHPIFTGIEGPIDAGRYHSLCVTDSGPEWTPLGTTQDGTLMAMAHMARPWVGLQFHPESILTPDGPRIVANFTEMCQ